MRDSFTVTKNNVSRGNYYETKPVYDKNGRFTSHFKQVMSENLFQQGTRKARQNDLEGAIADFDQVILHNPNYSQAYLNRGVTYRKLEKYQEAIADFDQVIRLYPNVAEFYVARGGVYTLLGEHQKALADYSHAIRLNPNWAEVYYNRGVVYKELGESQKAIADSFKAVDIFQKQGRIQEAQQILEIIKQLQSRNY